MPFNQECEEYGMDESRMAPDADEIFKILEGNELLWLSNYLLALSLTGIMLAFDVWGFVSRNVSVGHALRNFRIFTGCQAGKTGPERLIHLGCASCRAGSISPLFLGKDCCG